MKFKMIVFCACMHTVSVHGQNMGKDTTKHPVMHQGKDPGSDMNPDITPAGPAPRPDQVYTYVEQMPTQTYDLNKYLQDSLHYPKEAQANNVEGRVIVQFVVNEDGTFSDVKVIRGIGAGCDEEAIRVVKAMPRWNAARQSGNKVKCRYALPITFRLEEDKK